MLPAEAIAPTTSRNAPAGRLEPEHAGASALAQLPRLLAMTYSTVTMDGRNLWREHADVAVAQLSEALRLADLRGKQELLIENITPWIEVGQPETGRVPVIQKRIERHLAAACRRIGRDEAVCRLDLNRGIFSIRCYLGRMKPTDYVYEEDLISDSR